MNNGTLVFFSVTVTVLPLQNFFFLFKKLQAIVVTAQQFCPIGCSLWAIICERPTFTGYLLLRPQQVISLPRCTALSGLKGMPVSHYSFVSETPIPLRTRASLHPIKQCKVIQRPSAIFRHGGSKSITEGRYWDSWISTSSGRGVIMPLYLSTSSSLCLYHQQIHFPVSHYCTLPEALPVEIEILLNINIYRRVLACCLFCIQSKGRYDGSEMK